MQEERNPEQEADVEGLRTGRSEESEDETVAHRFVQREEGDEDDEVEAHRFAHSEDDDEDEVEAHSMGRLSLPEDPNTRF